MTSSSTQPAPIQPGAAVPSMPIKIVRNGEMEGSSTDALFSHGLHVVFSVPGAFTPTCSARHLPGFIDRLPDLRAKGVEHVACLAVNDPFVMKAWQQQAAGANDILMIADGSAEFTTALGLMQETSRFGMGLRGQRFALVIRDGVVERTMVEEPGDFSVSSADSVLRAL